MLPALLVLLPLVAAIGALMAWIGFGYRRFRAYHRFKELETAPLPLGALLRYTAAEGGAMLTLAWWHVRAAFADALRTPREVTGPPVLCIHGITQNGSNLWGIRRALERRGRPTRAVSMGRFGLPMRAYVRRVAAVLRDLATTSPDGTVDVVAHSLGGVVLRLAVADDPTLGACLGNVVTLGTPHAGTASTRGLPLRPIRELGRRSEVIGGLAPLPARALTTIAGDPDFVVYPRSTSHVEGARAVDLPGVGHAGLLTRRASIDAVVVAICGPTAGDPSG
jgi:pimeloyl-ACP methyl ester carboxylesterase